MRAHLWGAVLSIEVSKEMLKQRIYPPTPFSPAPNRSLRPVLRSQQSAHIHDYWLHWTWLPLCTLLKFRFKHKWMAHTYVYEKNTASNGLKPLVTLDNSAWVVYFYSRWLYGFRIEVYSVLRFFRVSLTLVFVSWHAGAVSNSILCKVFGWQTIKHAVGEWDLGCIRLMRFYGAPGWAVAHCSLGFDKSSSPITTWEWQQYTHLSK